MQISLLEICPLNDLLSLKHFQLNKKRIFDLLPKNSSLFQPAALKCAKASQKENSYHFLVVLPYLPNIV